MGCVLAGAGRSALTSHCGNTDLLRRKAGQRPSPAARSRCQGCAVVVSPPCPHPPVPPAGGPLGICPPGAPSPVLGRPHCQWHWTCPAALDSWALGVHLFAAGCACWALLDSRCRGCCCGLPRPGPGHSCQLSPQLVPTLSPRADSLGPCCTFRAGGSVALLSPQRGPRGASQGLGSAARLPPAARPGFLTKCSMVWDTFAGK